MRTLCLLNTVLVLLLVGGGSAAADRTLSLTAAYDLALRNHPSIHLLRERVQQAEAARYRAWGALKPTASFQGTFTHHDKEIVIDLAASSPVPVPGLEPIVFQKQNQFAFSAVAKLPLFMGPAYPAIGVARKQVELARLTEVRSRREFLLQVAQAYYLVVSQKEVVRALEHKVQLNTKHLAAARARFEVGQSARSEVLRADLVATQDAQKLRVEQNNLKAAGQQIGILLGLSGAVDVTRPTEPPSPETASDSSVREAMIARHDYRAALQSGDLARQAKDSVWWGFLPMLDLSWLYHWTEAAGFAGERGSWQLLFTLNVPLYDGGIRYANLREASSRIREAEAQRHALALQIQSEIVKLRSDVDSANAGVVSARKALELAGTTASDMEVSFEAGAVTQLDVLDGNQRLLDAELALTGALFQRDLARLALAHALGRFNPRGQKRDDG